MFRLHITRPRREDRPNPQVDVKVHRRVAPSVIDTAEGQLIA